MGEEAFDEAIIPCEDGMVLHVTGGTNPRESTRPEVRHAMTERIEHYRRPNGRDAKIRVRRARAFARFRLLRANRALPDRIDRAWGWVLGWDAALHPAWGYVAVTE